MQVIHPSELRKITKKEAMKLLKAGTQVFEYNEYWPDTRPQEVLIEAFIQVMRDNDPTGSALYCKEPK